MFKDQRTGKKNRPSLLRQLEIGADSVLGNNNKLNLPQIGSMKQIKLAKDINTLGSMSPNGSLQARKMRRAEAAGPRNKGSIEMGGMGIIGSSVKGKN